MSNFDSVVEIGETSSLIKDLSISHNYGTTTGAVTWTGDGKWS
jgi:hypothetical protein